VAWTLFDLAGIVGRTTLDLAIGTAVRRGLTSRDDLDAIARRLGKRGRKGTTMFRDVLIPHLSDPVQTESEAEQLVLRSLTAHGLPAPIAQHVIRRADGAFVARVDFAYPELKIAIEYDSYAHHLGTEAHDRDAARRNALLRLEWIPLTATGADLRDGGHALAHDVADARARRTGVADAAELGILDATS
jgi:hypothetical protein